MPKKGGDLRKDKKGRSVEGPGTGSRLLRLGDSKGRNDAKQAQWHKPTRTLRITQERSGLASELLESLEVVWIRKW